MGATVVVNIKAEEYDVYVGRAGQGQDGYFGNLYRGESLGGGMVGRKEAIRRFEHYFKIRVKQDKEYRERVLTLKGKRLGCFCAPLPCHGEVIAKWVEENAG